jgi:hypothetical protein
LCEDMFFSEMVLFAPVDLGCGIMLW